MQAADGADTVEAPENASAVPDALEEQVLAIEDWVSQESMSMPKDTNGTLIQKLNAALQLLQMVSDKVGCLEPHSRPGKLLKRKLSVLRRAVRPLHNVAVMPRGL